MSIHKLAGQTAIYGISTAGARFLSFLLSFYLTWILSPEGFGVVTDLYAIIPFALVVLTMGLESGYFRFAGKASSEEEKRSTFSSTWGVVTLASSLFLVLVLLFNNQIANITKYGDHPSYIWLTGAIIAVDAFTAMPFARLREQGRAKRYVVIRLLSVIVHVAFCVFFYSVLPRMASYGGVFDTLYSPEFGAGYMLVSNLIASVITVFLILPSCRGIAPRVSRKVLKPVMLYSLPLLISGIAGTANEFLDRQMIKYIMPEEMALNALGQFGAVSKLGVILTMFLQMYRLGAEPYFLGNFKKEDFVKVNAQAMKYYLIVAIGIFLGIVYFQDLLMLLIGRDLREGASLLPIILISNILTGVVLNLSFWYKQMSMTKYAIIVTGTGLVFTVIFNILLIPVLGILGAALARLVCEFVMVIVSYALNRKHCPTPYELGRIGEYALLGAVLYGMSHLTARLPEIPGYLCNLALFGIYGCYFLRREKIDPRAFARSLKKKN